MLVRPWPPSLACHEQKEQTEKNVSVYRGIYYHAYPYSLSPTNTGALSLAQTCRYGFNDPVVSILHFVNVEGKFAIFLTLQCMVSVLILAL